MANLKVTYDQQADAAYVYLSDPQTEVRASRMYACDPVAAGGMINLDFDASGRLLGIEVLGARTKLPHYLLDGAERLDSEHGS